MVVSGIEWKCMVASGSDGSERYYMVLRGSAWEIVVLHGSEW